LAEGLKLARSQGDETLTAEALIMLSYPVRDQGDLTTALALSDEAVAVARNVDDPSLLADAYGARGSTLGVSDLAAARRDLAEAFSLRQAMDDGRGMGEALGQLAVLDLREGNFDSARGHLDNALKDLRDTMDHRALVFPLSLFGLVNLLQGHELVARNAYLDVLILARRTGSQWAIASALLGLAECASATGRHDRAATLHGATANLCHQVGLTLDPGVQSLSEADQKRLRRAMGDTEFDSSYQIGLKSSLAGAVALALEARDLESE
jgi:tetratricopeptide (TPR) repeat protein